MTVMPPYSHPSEGQLHVLAESFVGQESAGLLAGLLLRLARFLQGDPALSYNVTVTSATAVQLPDLPAVLTSVFTVTGAPVQYRLDGSAPVVSDPVLQPGSVVTLLGKPSVQAFRAIATSATNAVLAGNHYD